MFTDFCALNETLSTQRLYVTYTVENVGGGIGQDPATKVTHLGLNQELMNRHGEKKRSTSVPILCRITLQNAPYMGYKLLVLMSFEVTTVTSMDSQEPACCDDSHLLAS